MNSGFMTRGFLSGIGYRDQDIRICSFKFVRESEVESKSFLLASGDTDFLSNPTLTLNSIGSFPAALCAWLELGVYLRTCLF